MEDDPNDVLLIERAFRKAGLPRPVSVRDGEQAVAYLSGEGEYADRERHPLPSLLLLDLKMPRMDGFEVLRWLRSHPGGLRRLPAVVLTGSGEAADIDRAYELGANSYLVKPPVFASLLTAVQTVTDYWDAHSRRPTIGP